MNLSQVFVINCCPSLLSPCCLSCDDLQIQPNIQINSFPFSVCPVKGHSLGVVFIGWDSYGFRAGLQLGTQLGLVNNFLMILQSLFTPYISTYKHIIMSPFFRG